MQKESEQNKQQNQDVNDNLVDKVGETNVYPVSDMNEADEDAKIVPPTELGDSDKEQNDK